MNRGDEGRALFGGARDEAGAEVMVSVAVPEPALDVAPKTVHSDQEITASGQKTKFVHHYHGFYQQTQDKGQTWCGVSKRWGLC